MSKTYGLHKTTTVYSVVRLSDHRLPPLLWHFLRLGSFMLFISLVVFLSCSGDSKY